MSSFDFAITVAIGSVIASTVLGRQPALLAGALALASLYAIQMLLSWARRHSAWAKRVVDNRPLLLMVGAQVIEAHLDEARMTSWDLEAKLRGAGVTHRNQLLAVVLETTGDVSVLKTGGEVQWDLFDGVRGAERLPSPADADRRHAAVHAR